jgi:hypothetical protein
MKELATRSESALADLFTELTKTVIRTDRETPDRAGFQQQNLNKPGQRPLAREQPPPRRGLFLVAAGPEATTSA